MFGEQLIRESAKFPHWSSSPLVANTSKVASLFVFLALKERGGQSMLLCTMCLYKATTY